MQSADGELAGLIDRVGRGDRAAFRALYDRSAAKLFGVILHVVRSREVAREVLQDVFLRIWQNAARFDAGAGRPMTWLICVARYAAIDARRRLPADPAALPEDLADDDDPERSVMNQRDLLRCLAQLDPGHQECVLLAYCSGYSREELAERFATPVATVKTWLRRALISLRLCLETP